MDPKSDSETYPDIYEVFEHYNYLYFENSLGCCILSWTDFKNNRSIGTCRYLEGGACEILLGNQLKLHSATELKNALLHEMIHAFLYITEKKKNHSFHGPSFTAKVEEINRISEFDHMRPSCGYNITTSHVLSTEVDYRSIHHWTCTSCGDVIKVSANKEPSASDFCIEKAVADKFCGNNSCHWHRHKKLCSGTYKLVELGNKGKEPMFQSGSHSDKGETSAKSSSKRKLTARQHEVSKSMDNSASSVKRIKTTNGAHEDKRNLSTLSASKRKLSEREHELKNIGIETPCQIPKRPRTTHFQKKDKKVIQVSKQAVKEDKLYGWSDEESGEDIAPMINKRTERTNIQKRPIETPRQIPKSPIETPCQIQTRPRTTQIQRENNKVNQNSKKTVKEDKLYSWYDEESDEDIVPLINKRTERIKTPKRHIETPCQIPNRPRTTQIQREDKKVIQDSEEAVKEDKFYSWSDEESDEDIVPLINKRTERRKLEKLLKLQRSQVKSANDTGKSSGNCVVYLSDDE